VASNAIFTLMNTTRMWFKPTGRLSLPEVADWYATFVITGLGGLDEASRRPPLAPLARPRPQSVRARPPADGGRKRVQPGRTAKPGTAATSDPSRRAAPGGR
jgi:hypothetical protein